ncbi:efflux RND transporter periplasmic adaptor subunit [Mucilaginibacter terrae]|uniref:Membrane fusion protein (Multidrug efflux system) n=1 Tax=Mucilaginibacter terrae TaxID=1955052 RepID=A0ABU3GQ39_9SPHI|nr:efflux RND transporter periplasmic adaptor subunit [Mucilaginibacter terrae]MDT3401897.1 membrane fusion protein (multidrug efflux system) [Mucilaginibacter terrae]
MKKLIYIPLILLAACSNKPKDKKAELEELKKQQAELNSKITKLQSEVGTTDSTAAVEVGTFAVTTGEFVNYVQIQGRIDAQDNVVAFTQSPGTITAIYAKPGQRVSRGQVLVQLDNTVLKQNIASAEAQLALNRTLYQRQKALWDQKIGTEVQYLQAKTTLEANEKSLAAVRQQANQMRIISPINGTIDQMDLKLGQAIQPGQNGIRIVNADNLKVKADVPESYAGSVNTGNMVKIVIPDAKDSLDTKVTFAAKSIDQASRSFAVEVKLPTRKSLRPNMTAILKIADYTKADAVVIPVKAIQRSEDGDFVYVNNNGIAKKVVIKAGATYGGRTEIVSGLKSGDEVIIDGANDVEDGDKVKVTQAAK